MRFAGIAVFNQPFQMRVPTFSTERVRSRANIKCRSVRSRIADHDGYRITGGESWITDRIFEPRRTQPNTLTTNRRWTSWVGWCRFNSKTENEAPGETILDRTLELQRRDFVLPENRLNGSLRRNPPRPSFPFVGRPTIHNCQRFQ